MSRWARLALAWFAASAMPDAGTCGARPTNDAGTCDAGGERAANFTRPIDAYMGFAVSYDECVAVEARGGAHVAKTAIRLSVEARAGDAARIDAACAVVAGGDAPFCVPLAAARRELHRRRRALAGSGWDLLYEPRDEGGLFLLSDGAALNASLWLADAAGARLSRVVTLDAACVEPSARGAPLVVASPFEGREPWAAWLAQLMDRNVAGAVATTREVVVAAVADPFLDWAARRDAGRAPAPAAFGARFATYYESLKHSGGAAVAFRVENGVFKPAVRHLVRRSAAFAGRPTVDAAELAAPPPPRESVFDARDKVHVWRNDMLTVYAQAPFAPVLAVTAKEMRALALPRPLVRALHYGPTAFVHVPKTGGTYLKSFMARCAPDVELPRRGHEHRSLDREHFLVLREPAARFESFLSMRLNEPRARGGWPGRTLAFAEAKNMTLDAVVDRLSDADMTNFVPFRTLGYFVNTKSLLVCGVPDALAYLAAYGAVPDDCAPAPSPPRAPRDHGRLGASRRARVRGVFANDTNLWRLACERDPPPDP